MDKAVFEPAALSQAQIHSKNLGVNSVIWKFLVRKTIKGNAICALR